MRRVLAGSVVGLLTIGLAIAQDQLVQDSGIPDEELLQDTAPPESLLPELPEDTAPPLDSPKDTGDTADTGEELDRDPCEGLGLFVGDLVFSTQRALDAFGADYSAVRGDLRIVGGEIQDLSALDCLIEVDGDFTLGAQPEEAPLDRLERVSGALRIIQTPIASVSLPALIQVGSLEVEANPALTGLSAPGLVQLKALVLTQNPRLTQVELPPLDLSEGLAISKTALRHPPRTRSASRIALEGNPSMVGVDGLEGIQSTSELVLTDNPSLRSLAGLSDLVVVTGELFLRDNGLVDLSDLAQLTVVGNLSVMDHGSLSSLAMPSLMVVGELRAERNALLGTLDLPHLTRASRLVVKECPALVAFGLPELLRSGLELRGLRNLSSLEGLESLLIADEVVLVGNERLSDVTALHQARIEVLEVDSNRKLREKEVEALRLATQGPG